MAAGICADMGVPAAVLFDFDGVIVDSERLHHETMAEAMAGDGPAPSWEFYREKLMGLDDRGAQLVMVKGAPLDAMTAHQRRFYFDQGGFLVGRFGIRAVPAVVEPNGKTMRVSEIPLGVGRK